MSYISERINEFTYSIIKNGFVDWRLFPIIYFVLAVIFIGFNFPFIILVLLSIIISLFSISNTKLEFGNFEIENVYFYVHKNTNREKYIQDILIDKLKILAILGSIDTFLSVIGLLCMITNLITKEFDIYLKILFILYISFEFFYYLFIYRYNKELIKLNNEITLFIEQENE